MEAIQLDETVLSTHTLRFVLGSLPVLLAAGRGGVIHGGDMSDYEIDDLLRRLEIIKAGLRFNGKDAHSDDVGMAIELIEDLRPEPEPELDDGD